MEEEKVVWGQGQVNGQYGHHDNSIYNQEYENINEKIHNMTFNQNF